MQIVISDYDATWPEQFARVGGRLRAALDDAATTIHHIGSTSVPGLAAKDRIDVQVTVADLDTDRYSERLTAAGFVLRSEVYVDHEPPGMTLAPRELRKAMAGVAAEEKPVNIHIREQGRFNQRYALLFRDFLRAHADAAAAYGRVKRTLATRFPDDAELYYDVKDPAIDMLMTGARVWADSTGWHVPPTDA